MNFLSAEYKINLVNYKICWTGYKSETVDYKVFEVEDIRFHVVKRVNIQLGGSIIHLRE